MIFIGPGLFLVGLFSKRMGSHLTRFSRKYKITFLPENLSGSFAVGTSVLFAARKLNVNIAADCGGYGICGKCKISVIKGQYPATPYDEEFLSAPEIARGVRLACKAVITGSSVVQAYQESSLRILAEGIERKVPLNPVVSKQLVAIDSPTIDENTSDLEKILKKVGDLSFAPGFIKNLPHRLRAHGFTGTLVSWNDIIIDFESDDTREHVYGVAFDLGTTTVVAKLIDLVSGKIVSTVARMNSQRPYGEDVISRITFANSNPDGVEKLQAEIIRLFNEMIHDAVEQTRVPVTQIYEITVAGNTVMEHLMLGVSPKYLAEMPYVPVFRRAQDVKAAELDIEIHPEGRVYLFPILGRFVGGDTSAVLLTLASRINGTWLAIDIGTNGEVVLCDKGRCWTTSAAAGPAFEGAHILHGMRASEGAIDRVFYHDDRIETHVIGETVPAGICGSGLLDAVGTLLQNGILDNTGRFVMDHRYFRNNSFKEPDGSGVSLVLAKNSEGQPVLLTQKDIREVQLAKGAIATAVKMLMKNANVRVQDLQAIYLAGAFGQYIRRDMALAIGLLPPIPEKKIHFIGNASCTGAELALISKTERDRLKELTAMAEYIEISADPEFQDVFTGNLFFPA